MDDATQNIVSEGRAPLWSRENLKRVTAVAPVMRPMVKYVPKNPVLLLGAMAVGVVGVLAWRNREKIADRARPLIEDATARARPMLEGAADRAEAFRDKLPLPRKSRTTDPAASI